MLPPPFNDFIFVPRLEEELRFFLENPTDLPAAVCFYGMPGIGKTSFAKTFAEEYSGDVQYLPMNETKIDKAFIKSLRLGNTITLMDCLKGDKPFSSIAILDEFHNLTQKQQDWFKVRIDESMEMPNRRLIVCLNTTNTKTLEKVLSPPIRSRLHAIDFDIEQYEAGKHAELLTKKFPYLRQRDIFAWLPDMRRIIRENELARVKQMKKAS